MNRGSNNGRLGWEELLKQADAATIFPHKVTNYEGIKGTGPAFYMNLTFPNTTIDAGNSVDDIRNVLEHFGLDVRRFASDRGRSSTSLEIVVDEQSRHNAQAVVEMIGTAKQTEQVKQKAVKIVRRYKDEAHDQEQIPDAPGSTMKIISRHTDNQDHDRSAADESRSGITIKGRYTAAQAAARERLNVKPNAKSPDGDIPNRNDDGRNGGGRRL